MSLIKAFEDSLLKNKLIEPGDTVFVACSGGPDSTALYHLLNALREKWKLKLGLLHFNHDLRGKASSQDQKFVMALAKQHEVSVYTEKANGIKKQARRMKESIEEAARHARYAFFEKTAKKYKIKKIALAHILQDQAETVFMRMVTGTGVRGLSGIRTKIEKGHLTYVRPLLDFNKEDLLRFLKGNRFKYCRDHSNRSTRFMRNKIRHYFLPWLEREINPRVSETLARLPAIVDEENKFFEEMENDAWKKVFSRRLKQKIFLNRKVFSSLARALQFRVLARALKTLDVKSGINYDAWQSLKMNLKRSRYCQSFPKDIDVALTPSRILIYKKYT
ncbi:MAG: tRNA lysidine(34) synthetase TilS [Candidatus Omnitrophica bacterium]|nr:tRNA lysidine(34) synthetase TilS [Candidatus Omnitrophota bacterium]